MSEGLIMGMGGWFQLHSSLGHQCNGIDCRRKTL